MDLRGEFDSMATSVSRKVREKMDDPSGSFPVPGGVVVLIFPWVEKSARNSIPSEPRPKRRSSFDGLEAPPTLELLEGGLGRWALRECYVVGGRSAGLIPPLTVSGLAS